ncbi:PilN domain-containing protein [Terrihabitans sp. B22-R8]|uniref:PilN domain-containing protein n=1 Tax=Terrihabitans sp. B22-R8 TaxID=3425128 RepID=UPI00403C85D0
MSVQRIVDGFSAWLDLVAETLSAALRGLKAGRPVRLTEVEDGFRLPGEDARPGPLDGAAGDHVRGRDVDLILLPRQFLLRPLELPRQAGDFLDGIVRSQIDRLTPWTASEAVFGWTAPQPSGQDRIEIMVAATSRSRIAPQLRTLTALGARSIRVFMQPDADEAPIRVHEQAAESAFGAARLRAALFATVIALTLAATLSTLASQFLGARYAGDIEAMEAEIGTQRRLLTAARDGAETSGLRLLERRKHAEPATVQVLDALARALPDHSHATEISLRDGTLRVAGLSDDAPALIGLIEQSPRFSRASFAAPTTRMPDSTAERFQIEAKIRPSEEAR